jgi:hypothetical protein
LLLTGYNSSRTTRERLGRELNVRVNAAAELRDSINTLAARVPVTVLQQDVLTTLSEDRTWSKFIFTPIGEAVIK